MGDDFGRVGEGNKIEMLQEIRFPHSLGLLYSAFTYYCGFKVNSGRIQAHGARAVRRAAVREADPRAN
jgi:predicted NodU family carbamoyl transferase